MCNLEVCLTLQVVIPQVLLTIHDTMRRGEEAETVQPHSSYKYSSLLNWILDYQPNVRWSELKVIMDKLEHQQELQSNEGTVNHN